MHDTLPDTRLNKPVLGVEPSRVRVTYRVRSEASAIEVRAQAIAIEQSVELPVEAIHDARILSDIVGHVAGITEVAQTCFDVQIGLSCETMPPEPGQLLNMLFGNTSLLDDVTLLDVDFPPSYLASFGGPTVGLGGLRQRLGAADRALTATALKPQGLPPHALAEIAHAAALGGIDIIKDDHGLADQSYSRFAERVVACAKAVAVANKSTGRTCAYAPSLSGSLDQLRAQIRIAHDEGVHTVLIAPMVVGLASFHALAREAPDVALLAHPSMAGACRIAPPLLLGRMFRMLGADATIFPNYGGRFSFSQAMCREIASAAISPWGDLGVCVPAPAGGMSLERIPEMLDVYGTDCMLLIGGGLLSAPAGITSAAQAFAMKVADHAK